MLALKNALGPVWLPVEMELRGADLYGNDITPFHFSSKLRFAKKACVRSTNFVTPLGHWDGVFSLLQSSQPKPHQKIHLDNQNLKWCLAGQTNSTPPRLSSPNGAVTKRSFDSSTTAKRALSTLVTRSHFWGSTQRVFAS
jgi:hypothetical protein